MIEHAILSLFLGQGEWDELGGMLKQWIRQRKLSKLAVDLNDSVPLEESDEEKESIDGDSEDDSLLASAEQCFEEWESHFDTDKWRQSARDSKRSVSAIYFHWAGPNDIKRPSVDEQFERIVGISSSYQFFMLREGEVLMRKHSCWCSSCFDVATAGSSRGMQLSSYAGYTVKGCTNIGTSFYEWSNKNCRAITGLSSCSPNLRARRRSHDLAENHLARKGYQWVLFEAYCDDDDELWLGKTIPSDKLGGACKMKFTGKQGKMFGTRVDKGDYIVAVQWYQRLCESGDGEQREFVMAKPRIDFVNSSELRLVGFNLKQIGEFSANVRDPAEGEMIGRVDGISDEERKKWELALSDESEALFWCR